MESPGSHSQAVQHHGWLGPFVHCNICTLAACDKVWSCDLPQNRNIFFFCLTKLPELSLLSFAWVSFVSSSLTTHRWAIYNYCCADLTLNYSTFSPLLFPLRPPLYCKFPVGFAGSYFCFCALLCQYIHGPPVWIYQTLLPILSKRGPHLLLSIFSPPFSFSQTHTYTLLLSFLYRSACNAKAVWLPTCTVLREHWLTVQCILAWNEAWRDTFITKEGKGQ